MHSITLFELVRFCLQLCPEYCHTYFWILKDLAWTQGWRIFSLSFGFLALAWWFVIAFHAVRLSNWDEIWNVTALFLWLFANFWWMAGEAHDHQYPYEDPVSDKHTADSATILTTALLWLAVYYLILLPLRLLPVNEAAIKEYDDGEFKPRFSYFRNFRQYENVHMMFWLAKVHSCTSLKCGRNTNVSNLPGV